MLEKIFDEIDFDLKPIPYSQAIKKPDKEGSFYAITYVSWDKTTPKDRSEIELKTIGKISILMPPKLPKGYRIQWCDEWQCLIDAIYSPRTNQYSFEYLDAVCMDCKILQDLKIPCDDIPYRKYSHPVDIDDSIHADYWEWASKFDRAWEDFEYYITQLTQQVVEVASKDYDSGKRVMPPEPITVIQKMLDLAKSGWSPPED